MKNKRSFMQGIISADGRETYPYFMIGDIVKTLKRSPDTTDQLYA